MGILIGRCVVFLLCVALTGCSARKAIEADALLVKREAAAVKDRTVASTDSANTIIGQCALPSPDCAIITAAAESIIADQAFIAERADIVAQAAGRIDDNADDVEDKAGWFSRLLTWLYWIGLAAAVFAVFMVLDRLGIAKVVSAILAWFPALIDWFKPSIAQQADAAFQVLDPDNGMTPEEAFAARRAADPVFNAAFQRRKQRSAEMRAKILLAQQQEVVQP